jgi:hypothetical protein
MHVLLLTFGVAVYLAGNRVVCSACSADLPDVHPQTVLSAPAP